MEIIKEAVKLAIEKRLPFYAYSLPGTDLIRMSVSIGPDHPADTKKNSSGFIMAPYNTSSMPFLFIKNDLDINGEEELQTLRNTPSRPTRHLPRPNAPTTYEAYLAGASEILEKLKSGEIRKAVYSRISEYESHALKSAHDWFEEIICRYPAAFRFIISSPDVTTWMGATPELLLNYSNGQASTMALAATKASGEARPWSEKEEEEQQIVTEYIKEQFRLAGITPDISPREEYEAGPVTHLCNKITAKGVSYDKALELLAKLHPTPAVCGVPVDKASRLIAEAEKRDRRYYSGYLGPVEEGKSFSLFVNLRSMEFFRERAQLYAGGGYTAASETESEWKETEHKTATLLSCINKKDEYFHR